MQEIIVEPTLEEKLGALSEQAIARDSQRRVLGIFSPAPDPPLLDDVQFEPPLPLAELEELHRFRSGKPLDEILARLGVQ
jgi:hypothetical protein